MGYSPKYDVDVKSFGLSCEEDAQDIFIVAVVFVVV